MNKIYELSWLWKSLGIALAAAVAVALAALICRAAKKRLGKKAAVIIGIAAFATAAIIVILLSNDPMPI